MSLLSWWYCPQINLCLPGRRCVSGVSLHVVLWAVLRAASWDPAELSVPQGQTRRSRLMVLLIDLDSATAAGLEQVCTIITHHFSHMWFKEVWSFNAQIIIIIQINQDTNQTWLCFVKQLWAGGPRHSLLGPVAAALGHSSLLHQLFVHLLPPPATAAHVLLLRPAPAGCPKCGKTGQFSAWPLNFCDDKPLSLLCLSLIWKCPPPSRWAGSTDHHLIRPRGVSSWWWSPWWQDTCCAGCLTVLWRWLPPLDGQACWHLLAAWSPLFWPRPAPSLTPSSICCSTPRWSGFDLIWSNAVFCAADMFKLQIWFFCSGVLWKTYEQLISYLP